MDIKNYFKREGYKDQTDGTYYVYLPTDSDDMPVIIYNEKEDTFFLLTDQLEKLINEETAQHLIETA